MREAARALRTGPSGEPRRIGFVPTMGALHEGHLSLVRAARASTDAVVLSIFVNPTQFGPSEDYAAYPRTLARDAELAAAAGVDCLFAPAPAEMYAGGADTVVEVEGLSHLLCGAARPGHFRGVATVVLKLFEIVRPDVAVFGQKDYQQSLVIRRMTRDLNLGVEIVVAPIAREADGLAMSSRNACLDPVERAAAPVLRRSLDTAERLWREGGRDSKRLEEAVRAVLAEEPLADVEYVAVADPETLQPAGHAPAAAVVAVAVRVGNTRLIDNTLLG